MTQKEKIVLSLADNPEVSIESTNSGKLDEETLRKANLDETQLSAEERKMVEEFSKKIDITETNSILQYGAAAQNKVADFSENTLKNVKAKDLGDVGDTLSDLVKQLKGFKISDKENIFTRLFKKGANSITNLKIKYDSADKNVSKIVDILEDHQVTLLKDISLLDLLYEKNLTNFKELTMYIIAGYKALDRIKNKDLPAAIAKAKETNAPEDSQRVNDLSNCINRFEKKLHDLELTRTVAIQMAPQIRLIQNNDTLMVEKIQSTLVNTIPVWKSQMVISLGISHSKEALKAENEVAEMTNKMLKQNAQNIKSATLETARQSERGIIDIETLTETNKKLIETLEEVELIQKEGKEKREQAQLELRKIEKELQTKLKDIKAIS